MSITIERDQERRYVVVERDSLPNGSLPPGNPPRVLGRYRRVDAALQRVERIKETRKRIEERKGESADERQ